MPQFFAPTSLAFLHPPEAPATENPPSHGASSAASRLGDDGSGRPPRSSASAEGRRPFFSKGILLFLMAFLGVCFILILATGFLLVAPNYATLKVADLTISNLTVATPTGATWKAALLAKRSWSYGRLFFTEVECFLYYHWYAAQQLAAAPAKPFMLRSTNRTVGKVMMTIEKPKKAVVAEEMDRERRSVGTMVVGLGLRMWGTYVYASWWKKKNCGLIEARYDDLRIAFANSTIEGSLVTGVDIATEDHRMADNLPSCSY